MVRTYIPMCGIGIYFQNSNMYSKVYVQSCGAFNLISLESVGTRFGNSSIYAVVY